MDQINYCIGCLQGCEWALFDGKGVTCLVNPRVGREYECDLTPVKEPKNVMVVGGGPAGLMAARTAAIRGHNVSLYESKIHWVVNLKALLIQLEKVNYLHLHHR